MLETHSERKKLAFHFILHNRAAALATSSRDGTPHVATVYCVVHKDLSAYFMTRVESRKYINVVHQPKVAMAFTDEQSVTTIQLTGLAERVEDLELEQEIWKDLMLFRIPWADKVPVPAIEMFLRGATNELAIIKVTPLEMTYASFESNTQGRYKTFFHKVI